MEGGYRHVYSSLPMLLHEPFLSHTMLLVSKLYHMHMGRPSVALLCSTGEGMKGSDEAAEGQATSLLRLAWGYVFEAPMGTLGFIEIR